MSVRSAISKQMTIASIFVYNQAILRVDSTCRERRGFSGICRWSYDPLTSVLV